MPWLSMGQNVGGAATQYRRHDVAWYRSQLGLFSAQYTNMGHPFGVTGLESRVSKASTRSRLYACGGFTDNWLVDEHFRVWRQGMLPPQTVPTITVGGGAVVQVPYVSFYDERTDERSPLSAPGASVTGNVSRAWSGLPTEEVAHKISLGGTTAANAATTIVGTATTFTTLRVGDRVALSSAPTSFASVRSIASDTSMLVDRALGNGTTQTLIARPAPRATHVELWVEVDGALPRLAVRRQIGSATATDSTATLALGEAAPDAFTRMPRGSFNGIYHERQCIAGVVAEPDTLYVSEILFPERYGGLSFKTRNGEPIVGMIPCRSVLLVFTAQNTYALRGYTEDDMVFEMIDADIGAFHHWAVQVIHGNAWVAGATGVFMWNGNYHMLISDRHEEWVKDVNDNLELFERGFTMVDPEDYLFMYVLPKSDSVYISSATASMVSDPVSGQRTVIWWADYYETVPEISGSFKQPEWGFDTLEQRVTSGAQISLPGSSRSRLYIGMCDGKVRAKNPDDQDGGETQGGGVKTLRWLTGHYLMDDPGGDIQEGKTFTRLWSYLESEAKAWKYQFFTGDEQAYTQDLNFTEVPASQAGITITGTDYAYDPKTVHVHIKEKLSGRGVTAYYEIAAPTAGIRWRGFGGEHKPGPATRGAHVVPEEG